LKLCQYSFGPVLQEWKISEELDHSVLLLALGLLESLLVIDLAHNSHFAGGLAYDSGLSRRVVDEGQFTKALAGAEGDHLLEGEQVFYS
jgi:hypothetical protein